MSNQSLVMSNRPSYVNLGSAAVSDAKQKRSKDVRQNEKIIESPSEDCLSHKSPQDIKDHQSLPENSSRNYKTSPTTPTKDSPSFYFRQSSEKKYLSDNKSNRSILEANKSKNRSNTFNVEKEILSRARNKLEQYVCDTNERMKKCTCEDIREANMKSIEEAKNEEEDCDEIIRNFTLWEKIVIFFDLNLLKDITYLNIMIGITIGK